MSDTDFSARVAALSPEKRELLLRRLNSQGRGPSGDALPQLVPDAEQRHEPFPLTDIQQVYWAGRSGLLDLSGCGTNVYMQYEIGGLSGRQISEFGRRVELAVHGLAGRHDMLRAVVLPDGRQQILPEAPPFSLPIDDLRGRADADAAVRAVRDRLCFGTAPIDRWPLFDLHAQRLDSQRIRLHIRVDAMLVDGTSRIMLLRELFTRLADPWVALPAPECSYRDYALAWASWQNTELFRQSREYWLRRLPELPPPPQLPLARPLAPGAPNRFVNRQAPLLGADAWQRLKARAATAGISPSGAVTAAFAEMLAEWSAAPRFTIGLVGTFRPPLHPQMREIIGNFHTLYLLAVAPGGATFEARAQRIQQQIGADLEHRYFSGFQALREWNRLRGLGGTAAMPILFNSVLEYSHPVYQQAESAAPAAPPPPAEHPTLLQRLRKRIVALARQRLDRAPQISEVEAGAYTPQILFAPTISQNGAGELVCAWLALEDAFPAGLLDGMLETYRQLLLRLADDPAAWDAPLPQPRAAATPPAIAARQPPAATLPVAPRSQPERQVAQLWAELLPQPPRGVADNFFDLGGDSFTLVRLAARLREQFGHDLPLAAFLREPTIEQLARLLDPAIGQALV